MLATAAIVVSLIVQGFTLGPLARLARFGRAGPGDPVGPGHEETMARVRLAAAGLARLDELAEDDAAPDAVIDRLHVVLPASAISGPARTTTRAAHRRP